MSGMTFEAADQDVRERIRDGYAANMCVEAGAGTGKTTVLVERIVAILKSGHARADELAVITFTEKAAAELSARVRSQLEKQRSNATGDEWIRLDEALHDLGRAHIETIHAFAASLLRERPFEAGLDPGFRVLDELPRQLAFEAAWDEWVTNEMAQDKPPEALVNALNIGLDWKLVREAADRLNKQRDVLPLAAYDVVVLDVDAFLADLRGVFAEFESRWEPTCNNTENKTLTEFQRMRELQGQIIALRARGEQTDSLIVWTELPNAHDGRKEDWFPRTTEPKKLLARVKDALVEAQSMIKQKATAELMLWVQGFVHAYDARRKSEGVADFDDLLLWARDLLRRDSGVCAYFRGKYRCVLVDEFQDTDPLQAEIIVRLCAEGDVGDDWRRATLRPGSLFVVGDPKQSIYRFRRADITMYDDVKRNAFGDAVETITQNFRSTAPVIEFVNKAFDHLLDPPVAGVQPAYVALDGHPAYQNGAVTVVRGEAPKDHGQRALDVRQAEARALAALISRELEAGTWKVRDTATGELRPATHRDIAILVPTRTELRLYEEQLSLAGIPYRHEGGRTFFERQEVRDLIAILRALDNPGDQVAVVAALRSPAFACSDEDLLLHKPARFDYLTLPESAEGLVADCLRALRELSRERFDRTLPEYVRFVVDALRLVESAMLQHQGEQAASNILKIIDQARAFTEARPAAGLRAFVRWLKDHVTRTTDETEASIVEESEDAVRIVTIHMSKGLEYGVVLFANMNTVRPDRTNVIVTRGAGGGRFHVRLGRKERKDAADVEHGFFTPGYEQAEASEREHARAEEIRLLYVAATRARDHLVLPFFHWEGDQPRQNLWEPKCLNDHLRQTDIDMAEDAIEASSLRELPGDVQAIRAVADGTDAERASMIESREAWQHARRALLQAQTAGLRVHTATGLKPAWEGAASSEHEVQRGRATDFGVAVHDVLERIDLDQPEDVAVLADACAREQGVSDRLDEVIACVTNVLEHEIIARAKASPRMLREVAFTAALPHAVDGGLAEGRIDLLFVEDGEMVVVDFKTDRVDEATAPERAAMYENQAKVYGWAVRETTGLPVREVLFLFARGPWVHRYACDEAFMREAEALLGTEPISA